MQDPRQFLWGFCKPVCMHAMAVKLQKTNEIRKTGWKAKIV
jgi:hypothetical protein